MNTKSDPAERTPSENEAIRKYMSELGKRAGEVNKKKGSEYFRKIRSFRKTTKKESK